MNLKKILDSSDNYGASIFSSNMQEDYINYIFKRHKGMSKGDFYDQVGYDFAQSLGVLSSDCSFYIDKEGYPHVVTPYTSTAYSVSNTEQGPDFDSVLREYDLKCLHDDDDYVELIACNPGNFYPDHALNQLASELGLDSGERFVDDTGKTHFILYCVD